MRTRYKKRAVNYLAENFKNQFLVVDDEVEIKKIQDFVSGDNSYLEIGPGKGRFILDIAARNKDKKFLVIELDRTISGIALKKIDESGLENVRLICGDFYNLAKFLNSSRFRGVFLNFSDPWPKKRHEKRRLTSKNFLLEYANILSDDGLIYFKTDNDNFFEYSREMFINYGWNIVYENHNYIDIDEFDGETEFENRYKNQGINIKRLILKKDEKTLTKLKEEEKENEQKIRTILQ